MAQTLINGLLLGSQYALLAIGYTLVFGVMHLLTLAHGAIFMASGLAALLISTESTSLIAAGLIAVGVGAVLGVVTDLACFRTVGYRRPMSAAVATIGFAILIESAITQIRGSSNAVAVPFEVSNLDLNIGPFLVSVVQLASFIIAIALMVGLHLFVQRTKWGMAMRGLAHDADMVGLLAVPTRQLTLIVLGISGALAGVASYLLALRIGSLSPAGGIEIGLTGLAVMAIGGLGSLVGAMAAGLGLGVIQAYASYWGLQGWQSAVPWVLLVVVLLVRPRGLVPARQMA